MNKNKLSKNEKKVLKIWGIVLVVIVLVLFIVNLFFPMKTLLSSLLNLSSDYDATSGEVTDYSRYSTVTTALDKFYAYLNQKDYDAVIKILDSDYVEENNITTSNIENYITTSDKQLTFDANIMYLVSGKNGVEKYVVDGKVIYTNTGEEVEKAYYQVVLDANNDSNLKLFSVKPITEDEYKEGAK